MKKILLLIDDLGSGGAQNQIVGLATELKANNYEVSFAVYFQNDFFQRKLEVYNIPVILFKKRTKIGFEVVCKLIYFIHTNQIDIIISFLDTPNIYAATAKLFSFNKPMFIASYRSKTEFENLGFIQRSLKYFINAMANKITANSHHERIFWQSHHPKFANKWSTIYNFIDFDKFQNRNLPRNNSFLVVATIGPAKNGLLIIKAIKILKEKGINCNIIWVGQKIYHLKDRAEYLNAMNRELIKNNISELWTWKDPIYEIEDFYNKCKALILASKVEGLPNAVCEAMACGMPCLVSDCLDHPFLLSENSSLLFSPNNELELANKIEAIIKMEESEIRNIGEQLSRRARVLFNRENFTSQYIKLIEN